MDKLFFGCLLVFLDIPLNFGSTVIELLPDFAGYLLICKGCAARIHPSQHRLWVLSAVAAAYSGLVYASDLLGIFRGLWQLLAQGGALLLSLLVSHQVLRCIQQTLQIPAGKLQNLRMAWQAQGVVLGIGWCLSWLPVIRDIAGLAGLLVSACFLVALYKVKECGKT